MRKSLAALPEELEFGAYTPDRLQPHFHYSNTDRYPPPSMTHYSSTAAIDIPFTRDFNQSGLGGDSQYLRYTPYDRFLISLLNHG